MFAGTMDFAAFREFLDDLDFGFKQLSGHL
jgi:hypothetical protein